MLKQASHSNPGLSDDDPSILSIANVKKRRKRLVFSFSENMLKQASHIF
jgi:hypothetical protein